MNIRYVRNKIKSISNVQKITKAMQLVSAVKMKKTQAAALEGRPYQEILERMIARVTRSIDIAKSPLVLENKEARLDLVIMVSTNKGLCGAYNFNLFRYLLDNVNLKNTEFITIGKKGAQFISRLGGRIIADFSTAAPAAAVAPVVDLAVTNYLGKKYGRVQIAHNLFISTIRYESEIDVLLPLGKIVKEVIPSREDYLIEPTPEAILDELIRSYIEERLRYILIENEAGEHSARMMAMKNATDNANELIFNLTLTRNKLRQQKITYELLDMVTAKESVEIN